MKNQRINSAYLLNFLFALVVSAFGLFDTSGYVITTEQNSKTQVELAVSEDDSIEESNFFFLTFELPVAKVLGNSDFYSFSLASYRTLIVVKEHSLANKLSTFNPNTYLLQLIRIPQNSDDPFRS